MNDDLKRKTVPIFCPNPLLGTMTGQLRSSGKTSDSAIATLIEQLDVLNQEVKWQSPRITETKNCVDQMGQDLAHIKGLNLSVISERTHKMWDAFQIVCVYWKQITAAAAIILFILMPFWSAFADRIVQKIQ